MMDTPEFLKSACLPSMYKQNALECPTFVQNVNHLDQAINKHMLPWWEAQSVRASSRYAKVDSLITSQGTYKNQPIMHK